MMEAMPHDEFIVVAVTLWAIWYAQRKKIHEDEFQSPLWTHLFIQNYLRDLTVALPSKGEEKQGVARCPPKWISPVED
jgi:hypothetical protein